jgi:hypothetical protein
MRYAAEGNRLLSLHRGFETMTCALRLVAVAIEAYRIDPKYSYGGNDRD